ncbi:MAG: hypothetical protein HDS14_02580 [Bacteroides sp.]|nr:hypothetical protein [Bacteroides sp.]
MKQILLLLGVSLGMYSLALAQNTENWKQAWMDARNAGDQVAALKWLKVGAEADDAVAQCGLAIAYLHGEGTKKDIQKVEFWAAKSAKSGYAYAQSLLGDLNYNVNHNYKEAIYWWEKAANQNDGHSIQQLANLYFNGDGVPKDEKEAFMWVERGAENGDVDAMVTMADALIYGDRGLEIDYAKALQWYEKAIATGNLSANYLWNVGHMYQTGMGTDINLKKAFDLFSKSAELKYGQAYNDLAYFYARGEIVPKNFDIALEMVDEAINLEPSSSRTCNFYDTKGEILLMQNKIDEAIKIWNKMNKEFPDQIKEISDSPFIKSIKVIANEK